MFVAISTYQKPIEEVLKVYPDHREWLLKHYNAGRFLVQVEESHRERPNWRRS